jgi:hypothetical protein
MQQATRRVQPSANSVERFSNPPQTDGGLVRLEDCCTIIMVDHRVGKSLDWRALYNRAPARLIDSAKLALCCTVIIADQI